MPVAKSLLLSLLCCCVLPASAQTPILSANPEPEIRLNVQVTAAGQPVSGLTQADFSVLDNRTGASIVSVKQQTPATEPVHAIILLDSVNVRYTELAYERDQVLKFLRSNGGKLAVPTSIAVLTDTGVKSQRDFSQDGNALAAGLAKQDIGLRAITRAAGFWGASERFNVSATALGTLSKYAATIQGRKFLLWVSPGWPLLSGPREELDSKQHRQIFGNIMQISNELRSANVTLYALNPLGASEDLLQANYYKEFTKGVEKPQDAQLGNLALQVLAEQSGGLALQGSTDVASMMTRCLRDADSWYEVRLARADSGSDKPYHRIEARVDKPGVELRTRGGYYAEQ